MMKNGNEDGNGDENGAGYILATGLAIIVCGSLYGSFRVSRIIGDWVCNLIS